MDERDHERTAAGQPEEWMWKAYYTDEAERRHAAWVEQNRPPNVIESIMGSKLVTTLVTICLLVLFVVLLPSQLRDLYSHSARGKLTLAALISFAGLGIWLQRRSPDHHRIVGGCINIVFPSAVIGTFLVIWFS